MDNVSGLCGWPQVGGYFHVLFEKPDAPQLVKGMVIRSRTSSTIRPSEQLATTSHPVRLRPGPSR